MPHLDIASYSTQTIWLFVGLITIYLNIINKVIKPIMYLEQWRFELKGILGDKNALSTELRSCRSLIQSRNWKLFN